MLQPQGAPQITLWLPNSGKYVTRELEASVMPFQTKSGGRQVGLRETTNCGSVDSDGICITGWPGDKTCAWEEQGTCGEVVAFSPDTRFEIEVRVSKSIAGWFRGRIQRPDIAISSFSKTSNTVIVSAEPTSVARLEAKITKENTTEAQRTLANVLVLFSG